MLFVCVLVVFSVYSIELLSVVDYCCLCCARAVCFKDMLLVFVLFSHVCCRLCLLVAFFVLFYRLVLPACLFYCLLLCLGLFVLCVLRLFFLFALLFTSRHVKRCSFFAYWCLCCVFCGFVSSPCLNVFIGLCLRCSHCVFYILVTRCLGLLLVLCLCCVLYSPVVGVRFVFVCVLSLLLAFLFLWFYRLLLPALFLWCLF